MKKILLFAAAAFVAASASAQADYDQLVNKVVNGSFEAPGTVASVPSDWTWDPWNTVKAIEKMEGWNCAHSVWNGVVEFYTGEDNAGDGDLRGEEDYNFVRLLGYNDNGWTNITMSQTVEGLTAGEEYNFQFLIGVNWPTGTSWTPDPNYGFRLAEADKDADGNDIAGKEIINTNLGADPDFTPEQDWQVFKPIKVTAPADGKLYIEFYYGNTYGQGNKTDGKWMTIDNVALWNEKGEGGIEGITVEGNNEVLGVYNLNGVRVANNVEALGASKGLYIVRTANGAHKVVR